MGSVPFPGCELVQDAEVSAYGVGSPYCGKHSWSGVCDAAGTLHTLSRGGRVVQKMVMDTRGELEETPEERKASEILARIVSYDYLEARGLTRSVARTAIRGRSPEDVTRPPVGKEAHVDRPA